ncbi:Receptor-like protein 12 [Morella rubra]|uniref:Receptor-like protein 12 n=1 Tax=Morella rubra TaxID=262757 RepID=A0A6A1WU81_9ROSI|nr:Receptor-like protein 12 [Morella rubra]
MESRKRDSSSDCCSWDGVECDHYTGHVISLDLSTSCLYGSINSNSSLFRLLQLQGLNLALNDFNSSQIPIGVGSLSRKFPNILLNHNKLVDLQLSGNNLRGLIPRWMYNVSKEALRLLVLSDNFLTGFEHSPVVLPWNNLQALFLENNMLQGLFPVPPPSITDLYISNNSLSGFQQPLEMLQRSNLEYFMADNNRLQGLLPIPPPSIRYYQGQMPRSLANCGDLEYLNVGNNRINDTFPFWLKKSLPVEDFHSPFQWDFMVQQVTWKAMIPCTNCISLTSLTTIFLENLPVSNLLQSNAMKIVSANRLQYMRSGVDYLVTITNKGIELEYKKIKDDLTVIDFSCNRFKGEIPKLLGNLKGLHVLNLSNNALTGPIPLSLGNLTQLESLDLSRNMLFGEIPGQLVQLIWLGSLMSLIIIFMGLYTTWKSIRCI